MITVIYEINFYGYTTYQIYNHKIKPQNNYLTTK